MNWIKYITVAFLPLTLFLGVIIVFRLSVISGLLNGFALAAQMYSVPAQLRYLTLSAHGHPIQVAGINFVFTLRLLELGLSSCSLSTILFHSKMTTVATGFRTGLCPSNLPFGSTWCGIFLC